MTKHGNHTPEEGSTEPGSSGEETWLSELYREAATEMPPPELDRKVLAAAQGAVRHPLLQRKSWHAPFLYGTAASALLAAGLWFQMVRDPGPVPRSSAIPAPHQIVTGAESRSRKLRSEPAPKTDSNDKSAAPTMLAEQATAPKGEKPAALDHPPAGEDTHARVIEEVIVTAAQRSASDGSRVAQEQQPSAALTPEPMSTSNVRSFSGVFGVGGQTDEIRIFNVGDAIWLEADWGGTASCPTPFRLPDNIALKGVTTLSLNSGKLALRLPSQEGDLLLSCSVDGWKLKPWPYPEHSQNSP